jgi:hypothetical protein
MRTFTYALAALGLLILGASPASAKQRASSTQIQEAESYVADCERQFAKKGSAALPAPLSSAVRVESHEDMSLETAHREIREQLLRPGTCLDLAALKASLTRPVRKPVLALDIPVPLYLAGRRVVTHSAAALIPDPHGGNMIMVVDTADGSWGPGVVFLAFPDKHRDVKSTK